MNKLPTPREVYKVAVKNGHYAGNPTIYKLLDRVRDECDEAASAFFFGTPEGTPHCPSEELADIIIIVMSIAGRYGIDVGAAVVKKHLKNKGATNE